DDNIYAKRLPVETLTLTSIAAGTYQFSSNAFFPLDGRGWQAEPPSEPSSGGHNFGFTSETRYWFEYEGTEVLPFFGDDDVCVYSEGQLCLDSGGIHAPEPGVTNFANP